MLNELTLLSAKDMGLYLYCDIYKQYGKLVTTSNLDFKEEPDMDI